MPMCVRLGGRALLALLFVLLAGPAEAQLIDGVDRWADAVVGLSSTKWAGPRVPFPAPTPRPQSSQRLDSASWPISVHAGPEVGAQRLSTVLAAAEATFELLDAAGFLTSFGDAGQGGTGGRDLYLRSALEAPALAALDPSGNFSALDGGRAFAELDARLPEARVFACTAQALIDAQLFELDPAESTNVRRGSAAFFATLVAGDPCEDPRLDVSANPFVVGSADAGDWFARLSARQDGERGTFLFDMWQFARQRTWEGVDLRASPNLLEAIDKTLDLAREEFALVSADLAARLAERTPSVVRDAQKLPFFSAKTDAPLGIFGSKHVRVPLKAAHAGQRLRAWSKGEGGGRYVLTAERLDARGNVLAHLEVAPRRDPNSQLSIELDDETEAVLVSVTRYADEGIPQPDTFAADDLRQVHLTIDQPNMDVGVAVDGADPK